MIRIGVVYQAMFSLYPIQSSLTVTRTVIFWEYVSKKIAQQKKLINHVALCSNPSEESTVTVLFLNTFKNNPI
jgi:hypothetical protein